MTKRPRPQIPPPDDPGTPVHVLGRCATGVTLGRRNDRGQLETTHMELMREGKPIPPNHSVALLTQDTAADGGHRLRIVLNHSGPARANTPRYREHYDAIFGHPSRGNA